MFNFINKRRRRRRRSSTNYNNRGTMSFHDGAPKLLVECTITLHKATLAMNTMFSAYSFIDVLIIINIILCHIERAKHLLAGK